MDYDKQLKIAERFSKYARWSFMAFALLVALIAWLSVWAAVIKTGDPVLYLFPILLTVFFAVTLTHAIEQHLWRKAKSKPERFIIKR